MKSFLTFQFCYIPFFQLRHIKYIIFIQSSSRFSRITEYFEVHLWVALNLAKVHISDFSEKDMGSVTQIFKKKGPRTALWNSKLLSLSTCWKPCPSFFFFYLFIYYFLLARCECIIVSTSRYRNYNPIFSSDAVMKNTITNFR